MVAFILRCIFRLGLWLPVLVLSPLAAGDIPNSIRQAGLYRGGGGSGCAIQQYIFGQNFPGLIDTAIPQQSY